LASIGYPTEAGKRLLVGGAFVMRERNEFQQYAFLFSSTNTSAALALGSCRAL